MTKPTSDCWLRIRSFIDVNEIIVWYFMFLQPLMSSRRSGTVSGVSYLIFDLSWSVNSFVDNLSDSLISWVAVLPSNFYLRCWDHSFLASPLSQSVYVSRCFINFSCLSVSENDCVPRYLLVYLVCDRVEWVCVLYVQPFVSPFAVGGRMCLHQSLSS